MGDLIETDHDVAGKVYILDQDTLVIDEFSFDNNGFGVYINVATKGRNKKQWAKNRIDVPYPSGGFSKFLTLLETVLVGSSLLETPCFQILYEGQLAPVSIPKRAESGVSLTLN